MNCDRVRSLLNAYVDGELDLVTALDIEQHLQSCQGCAGEQRTLQALRAATRERALYHAAPAGLEKRIRTALPKTSQPTGVQRFFSWRWIAPAAAVVVILVIALAIVGRGLLLTNQQALLAQQVQGAHVRSLIGNHLMDVISTDQHTVKPWFDGKLDFSPPVPNLAAEGYPLLGGRLDYIGGRNVAALVYQRNKHIINVFVWPDTSEQSLKGSTSSGYHLYRWNQGGMAFWAVSDLNEQELLAFIQDFQKAAGD